MCVNGCVLFYLATPPAVSRSVSTPAAASESGKIFRCAVIHMYKLNLVQVHVCMYPVFSVYRKQWSVGSMSTVVLVDVPWDTAHQTLLDEIFFFIGSKPEEAVRD